MRFDSASLPMVCVSNRMCQPGRRLPPSFMRYLTDRRSWIDVMRGCWVIVKSHARIGEVAMWDLRHGPRPKRSKTSTDNHCLRMCVGEGVRTRQRIQAPQRERGRTMCA